MHSSSDQSPARPPSIGAYAIVRRIGAGGAGEVFLAIDKDGSPVALKVPNDAAWGSQPLMLRFLREGRAATVLDHPGIVPLVAVGTPASPYLAFGYCDGPNLREWLADHTDELSERTVCRWLELVADAVAHAHEHGIVHRDIKPSNILLAPDEDGAEGCRPLLSDFGLARVADAGIEATATGTLLGTPEFMAPEQSRDAPSQVGPAADVWSLGVLLYRLLTGRLPFLGRTRAETLLVALLEDPLAPRRLRRGLSRELEAICLKCLEKRPGERYATAAELRDDLRRFQSGGRTIARPRGPLGAGAHWLRRRPVVATLMLAACLGLLSGLVGLSLHENSLRQALNLAEHRRRQAETLSARLLERDRSLRQGAYAYAMALAGRLDRAGLNPDRIRILLDDWKPASGEDDLRGFAWSVLHAPQAAAERTIRLPTESAAAMAALPGRPSALIVGSDGFAGVVSLDTGEVLRVLKSESVDLFVAAVSPTGRFGAASGSDGKVAVWDLESGRRRAYWKASDAAVHSLVFLDDGRLIAGGRERRFRVFRVPDGTPLGSSIEQPFVIVPTELWPDGGRLSAGLIGSDGTPDLAVCDLTGKVLIRKPAREHHPTRGALAPDGLQGVTGGMDGKLRFWSAEELADLGAIDAHPRAVRAVKYSPDGDLLASGGDDGTVTVWDVKSRTRLYRFRGFDAPVSDLVFFRRSQLAAIGLDSRLQTWELSRRRDALRARELPPAKILAGGFDAAGTRVWLAFDSGEVGCWSAEDGRRLRLYQAFALPPVGTDTQVRFSPDGRLIAVAFTDIVQVLRTADEKPHVRWGVPQLRVHSLQFAGGGQRIFAAGKAGGWWNLSGILEQPVDLQAEDVWNPIFGSQGSLLFSRLQPAGTAQLEWRRRDSTRRFPTPRQPGFRTSHSLSPDGRIAAWASGSKVSLAREDGARELPVLGNQPAMTAFSRDGRNLAAASQQSVSVFDVPTEQEVLLFDAFGGDIVWLAFAPGDRLLAAAYNHVRGPTLHFWHAADPEAPRKRQAPNALRPPPRHVVGSLARSW